MTSRAEQYRQLAGDFQFMARSLPPGENRSTLLNMAEECDRLADECERQTDQQEQATEIRTRAVQNNEVLEKKLVTAVTVCRGQRRGRLLGQ